MKNELAKFSLEQLRTEIERRTPYVFSTETPRLKKIPFKDFEKQFVKEWTTGEDDVDWSFWVYKKCVSKKRFVFGFMPELSRMYFTRKMIVKDHCPVEEYDYKKHVPNGRSITKEEMEILKKLCKKYPTWKVAQKKFGIRD